MSSLKLFEEVVGRTGLASFIGPGAVERALSSVGSSSASARVDDYRRALPQLRSRMAIYLKPEEVERRVNEIESLLV